MYLYYDKELKLRTSIIHGEPVRQGSDLNVFVCFDSDFFRSEYEAGQSILTLNITGVGETEKSPDFFPDIAPKLCQFKKVSTNEVSYDLIDGHFYWTFGFNFTVKEATSKNGRIAINGTLSKFNKIGDIDQGTLEEEKALGVANIYVEKTVGLERQNDCSITTSLYESLLREIKWVDSQNINIDTASQVYTDLRDVEYVEPEEEFNFTNFDFYCNNFSYGSRLLLNRESLHPNTYPKLAAFLNTCPMNFISNKSLIIEIDNRVDISHSGISRQKDGGVVLRAFFKALFEEKETDFCYEYVNNWSKVYPFISELNGKLDKSNEKSIVYINDENGNPSVKKYNAKEPKPNEFVLRDEEGHATVNNPKEDQHAATKLYVDIYETLNRIGLMWVSEYDGPDPDNPDKDDTGVITFLYNPSLIESIKTTRIINGEEVNILDEYGIIDIFPKPIDWECKKGK